MSSANLCYFLGGVAAASSIIGALLWTAIWATSHRDPGPDDEIRDPAALGISRQACDRRAAHAPGRDG